MCSIQPCILDGNCGCDQSNYRRASAAKNSLSFRQTLGIILTAETSGTYAFPLNGYTLASGEAVLPVPKYHTGIDDDADVHLKIQTGLLTLVLKKQFAAVSPSVLGTTPAATSGLRRRVRPRIFSPTGAPHDEFGTRHRGKFSSDRMNAGWLSHCSSSAALIRRSFRGWNAGDGKRRFLLLPRSAPQNCHV